MTHFLVYSAVNDSDIGVSLGRPEYSYYFVLKEFIPVLEQLGSVTVVTDPQLVDELSQNLSNRGEHCLFLSFSPPHLTRTDLSCPTIPVFAWEFDTLPSEVWYEEPEQNWAYGLAHWGRAIVHSELTAEATRRLMGDDFPVVSIPAPVWDRMATVRALPAATGDTLVMEIRNAIVVDTATTSLEPYRPGPDFLAEYVARSAGKPWPPREDETSIGSPEDIPAAETPAVPDRVTGSRWLALLRITLRYAVEWYRLVLRDLLPSGAAQTLPAIDTAAMENARALYRVEESSPWQPGAHSLSLSGVIFTSVFNPYDGRKNWRDLISAFCDAFRHTPDATLVCKLTHQDYHDAIEEILRTLARLPTFECRIVLLHGYLDQPVYQQLIAATAFVVNASHGEGQCLPLMEYLSSGKPAIAPRHSAMQDYIDDSVGFVVHSWLDATAWPHDPRVAYRTCRHQIDWTSLRQAYVDAYRCFREDPLRYRDLSEQAIRRMQGHCSRATALHRLREIIATPAFHSGESVSQSSVTNGSVA